MDEVKAKPTAVERILAQARDYDRGPEEPPLREAFDEVRNPKRTGRQAIMLDVRKADGQRYGMSYAYLTRVDFEPGDRLKIHFARDVVQIEGRRLEELYRRLLDHRVDAIQEGTAAEDGLKPEEASHIDRLQLITATEADHDD